MFAPLQKKAKNDLHPKLMKEQTRIIKCGSGYDAYKFARDVRGADIGALQNKVINDKYGHTAYEFAINVKGADYEELVSSVFSDEKRMREWMTAAGQNEEEFWADERNQAAYLKFKS